MEQVRRNYLVWGAGGHARVVSDVIRATGGEVCVYVDRVATAVTAVAGATLLDEAEFVERMRRGEALREADSIAFGIGANQPRLAAFYSCRGFDIPFLIHPAAIVSPSATIGDGSLVMPGAVVNAGARIGSAVIVNTGAIIEHDCVLEDGVHVSPGAVLAGGVHIASCAWIGASATVIQGRTVGEHSIVGAGAVVIRDVSPHLRVVGVPARPLPTIEKS